ncbi:HNH endonuclease family protein, partial [uncultured Flavobacterium sp.]|uniref:HNH endonuclease family protein n=1 Tax=uncultured Flavobacterium sp. TaxID=165435 RepID=UPI0025E3673E
YNNGSTKYILLCFTNQQINFINYKDLQIEHIFSKEPNYDLLVYGFDEDYNIEKNRIGNLCLLEQNLNKGLGNSAPSNKIDGYIKSSILSTRNIGGEIQQGNYNKVNVDRRRSEILKFCIERFKIKFIEQNIVPGSLINNYQEYFDLN